MGELVKSVNRGMKQSPESFAWSRRSRAVACAALFVASVARFWLPFDPKDTVPHDPESVRLARNLAERGEFSNPFVPLETGPSAHTAPAFPAFVAVLIRTFGEGSRGMYALKLAALILMCSQIALFPVVSGALGMGELNGVVGAVAWIYARVGIDKPPGMPATPMYGFFLWEAFWAAFLALVAVVCCRRYLDSEPPGANRLAWLIGGLFGLLSLTSPVTCIVFLGWMGWVVYKERWKFLRKSNLTILLVAAVIATPWLVRNYLVFHRPVFIRDDFGLELSVANNDCASFGISQNIESGCFDKNHPNTNFTEAMKVLQYGEPKYNEVRLREAELWIETHPRKFLKLCGRRFMAFWLPPSMGIGRRPERASVDAMTVLSLAGLVLLYRKDRQSAMMCVLCLGLFPLVYYFVEYEYRYRYPILWLTFLLGALPVTAFAQRSRKFLIGILAGQKERFR